MGDDIILKNKQWGFINQHYNRVGCFMMSDDNPESEIDFSVMELLTLIITFESLSNSEKASTLEKDSLSVFCARIKPTVISEKNFDKKIKIGKEIYGLLGIALKLLR